MRMSAGDFNRQIIEEFRTNNGKVGGPFATTPLLLLHHTGAKSGTERVNPLAYQRVDGDTVAVFASKGGAPTHPDWYHNLVANPDARIEIGTEAYDVLARVATERGARTHLGGAETREAQLRRLRAEGRRPRDPRRRAREALTGSRCVPESGSRVGRPR